VIADVIDRGQPGLARAIGLGRWAGFRRSTICEITEAGRILTNNGGIERRLRWITEKSGVMSDKPEDPRLTDLLDHRTWPEGDHLAYNKFGLPFAARQLSQALERVIGRLALDGDVREGLTFHGLRHARGVELARAGASDAIIMAQLEHRTTHSARIYRRQAERATLADLGQDLINQKLGVGRR
jgi:integrase